MPFGYAKVLNQHARNVMFKAPSIPDFRCMVGTAECLAPLPVLIQPWTPDIKEPVTDDVKNLNAEKVASLGEEPLSETDFPKSKFYMGKATGGV